jgi:hypothetical protein
MAFLVLVPVGPHDLAFRVDEAALRSDRTGRVERGEGAVVVEKGVRHCRVIKPSSRELAKRVDSVDQSISHIGHVNLGEDAFVQHEAMRVPICIIKLSCDRVRAIPVGCSCGRLGHVNRGKAILGPVQTRDTQKQAKRNSRKRFPWLAIRGLIALCGERVSLAGNNSFS